MSAAVSATAIASLAVAAISAGAGVYGSIQAGQAQKRQANYQAQVMRNNATLAERAAKDAEARGEVAANQKAMDTRQLMGRQTAAIAANGVDVGFGTPVDILGDTAAFGELDQNTIRDNARKSADNYRAQGGQFQGQANLYDSVGSESGGWLSAIGTGLGGVGTVADKWYKLDQAGAFGSSTTTQLGGGKT